MFLCQLPLVAACKKLTRTDELDLDVDLNKPLRQGVDLHKTRIHCAVKAAEFGDQTNLSLKDCFVCIGADNAARNSATGADNNSKVVDHTTIPVVHQGILAVGLDNMTVGRLEILAAWRLDLDDGIFGRAAAIQVVNWGLAVLVSHGGDWDTVAVCIDAGERLVIGADSSLA